MATKYDKDKHKNIKYQRMLFDGSGYLYKDLDSGEMLWTYNKVHNPAKVVEFMGHEMEDAVFKAQRIINEFEI